MKLWARVLTCALSVALMVSLFGGCGKDEESGTDTASVGLSTADISYMNSDGSSVYKIIRPDDPSDAEASCAIRVFKAMKDNFGCTPTNTTDAEDGNCPEILIGKTNREETAIAKAELVAKGSSRSKEYIICTVGEDIVIYGNSDDSLKDAIEYFVLNYLASSTVAGGIYNIKTDMEGYENISIFGDTVLSKIKIVRPIYNVSYITQTETDKLISTIYDKTGYDVEMIHDNVASNNGFPADGSGTLTKTEENEFEIVIGNCVRDGVKTLTDKNQYEIRIEDKRIFLNGGSPYATAMAVSEFITLLTEKKTLTTADSVASGSYKDVVGKYDTSSYYTVSWADDFDGTEIDTSKWFNAWGRPAYTPADGGKPSYRGNYDLQNNYVADGKLYMEALETSEGYYGGLMHTQGIMEFKYGYLEMSTIKPCGGGFWTALYTMSAVSASDEDNANVYFAGTADSRTWYSETDVEECIGEAQWMYTHVHAWPTQHTMDLMGATNSAEVEINLKYRHYTTDDRAFWMDFHTYGYEWIDNTKVRHFVDGVETHVSEFADKAEFLDAYSQSAFLRLGLAVGTEISPLTATSEQWENSNKYIIDYIHIYQLKGQELYLHNNSGWDKIIKG